MRLSLRLITDERGATAIEYGLIAALICVSAIAAMSTLGGSVSSSFTKVSTIFAAANAAS